MAANGARYANAPDTAYWRVAASVILSWLLTMSSDYQASFEASVQLFLEDEFRSEDLLSLGNAAEGHQIVDVVFPQIVHFLAARFFPFFALGRAHGFVVGVGDFDRLIRLLQDPVVFVSGRDVGVSTRHREGVFRNVGEILSIARAWELGLIGYLSQLSEGKTGWLHAARCSMGLTAVVHGDFQIGRNQVDVDMIVAGGLPARAGSGDLQAPHAGGSR